MSETTVKGLADLQRALDELPAKLEANIMRGALRAGTKVLATEAKRLAPVGPPSTENQRFYGGRTGLLRDSIRIKTKMRRGRVTASVTAGGKTKDGGDPYYARFVEYGTAPHVITARRVRVLAIGVHSVQHPGAQKKPFMRPALDTMHVAAVEAVREYIRNRLATKHGINVPAPREEGNE